MISNSELYDNNYIKGLENPQYNKKYSLRELYDSPSDAVSFTDNLKKKGKTDLSIRYFSNKELYNVSKTGGKGDGEYITNVNNFLKTSYYSIDGAWISRGAIDPAAGSPIRLRAPDGVSGYLECLTRNNSIGKIQLASAPSDIQNSLNVETASGSAIGASQGFDFFSSVGTRTVSFMFDVYADYLPAPYNDVLSYCKALLQMNYPTYSSNIVNSPTVRFEYAGIHIIGIPHITCVFGNTIKHGVVDKAQVSVNITETEPIVSGKVIL